MNAKFAAIVSAVALAVATLSGCATLPGTEAASQELVVSDAWIKAVPDLADANAMTGMFMTLENRGDADVYITGGTAEVALTDMPLEAHEVVSDASGQMVMQKTANGILIPAHSSVQLKPGGFHIMFMMLKKPIMVGDTVNATLTLNTGETLDVTADAMTLEGGVEQYVPNQ